MPAKVIAKTKGMEKATTKPVRKPNEKKLTNKTIMTASASTLTNSWILRCTATGWSDTFVVSYLEVMFFAVGQIQFPDFYLRQ